MRKMIILQAILIYVLDERNMEAINCFFNQLFLVDFLPSALLYLSFN